EIARPHRAGRNQRIGLRRAADAQTFVIREEEGAIGAIEYLGNPHRPANGRAELVLFDGGPHARRIEEVARIENLIAEKLKDAAVYLIRARLQRDRNHGHALAVFRGEAARLYRELLNRVDGGSDGGDIE